MARQRSLARVLGAVGLAAVLAAPLAVSGAGAPADAAQPSLIEVGAPFSRVPLGQDGRLLDFSAGEVWSSAAVADVTGDGRPEIVVGGSLSAKLRVYRTDGSVLRTVDVGGVDLAGRRGGIQASPAVADIDADGVLDVVVASTSNVVAAYSFKGGGARNMWRTQHPARVTNGPNGMIATPATGYLSPDLARDVATASWGQLLGAQSGRTGANLSGWPVWLWDTLWSSPAIGDIDGDGRNEVVVGGDCEGNTIGTQPCGATGGGYVWAFNADGSEKWRTFLRGQTVWSSPALGDLTGDGALDVVVGSGAYWPEPAGRSVTALDGRNGRVLWQAATPARVVGSPSLADVTGDGRPDVFVVTHGGFLLALDGVSGRQLWRACITDSGNCGNTQIGTKSGVAIADIDGDGALEVVTQGEQRLRVFDARTGAAEASVRSAYDGTIYAPANAPTIAQVDGQAWIVQPVRGTRGGADELVVTVWRTGRPLGAAPWPTFKGNVGRTGATAVPAGATAANQAFVRQAYRDFLGRDARAGEVAHWTARLDERQTDRYGMATELSRSDEWLRAVISRFYRDTLGREPDAGGLAGWTRAARDGMPIAQIASAFYASPEYFRTTGQSSHDVWVRDLYRKLLHREPDAAGHAGWVRALQQGMRRDTLAHGFYQSPETLSVRIDTLYRDLLGRPAEPGGIRSWSPMVRSHGDLVLAAALAASQEYYQKARR